MTKPQTEKKPTRFKLFASVWYLDAFLFWAIFTSGTIFMLWIFTSNVKERLRNNMESNLYSILQSTSASLLLTLSQYEQSDKTPNPRLLEEQLDSTPVKHPMVLAAFLATSDGTISNIRFRASRHNISTSSQEALTKALQRIDFNLLILEASRSYRPLNGGWDFLSRGPLATVTTQPRAVEFIAQSFEAPPNPFVTRKPILVLAIDAPSVHEAFQSIDEINARIVGLSIIVATLLSLLIRRRSLEREQAVREKLAALTLLRQRDAILAVLAETGDKILTQKNIANPLARMFQQIQDVLRVESCYFVLEYSQQNFSADENSQIIIGRKKGDSILPNLRQLDHKPWREWKESLNKGKPIAGSIEEFSFPIRQELQKAEIKGVAAFPIFLNEKLSGLLLIEDQHGNLVWEAGVLDSLRLAAELIGTAYDHERQERLMRQSSKMEALGQMAGGVAHEFNNLLHIIAANLRVMQSGETPTSKQNDALSKILNVTDRGAEIVEHLLNATRQTTPHLLQIDLNDLIRSTLTLAKPAIKATITVSFSPSHEPLTCLVDEGQISQVLLNLILNANDAVGEDGSISIETGLQSIETHTQTKQFVICKVIDNGTGISPEIKDRIFDPFVTTKAPGAGTGLGLSTCKGIVERHSGHIEAHNLDSGGAVFTIALPFSTSKEHQKTPSSEPPAKHSSPHPLEGLALVADDEPFCLEVVQDNLHEANFQVLAARNGEEAIALAKQHASELRWIVTDWTMPGLSGPKLVNRLREIVPQARIIVTSGYALTAEENPCIDAVISKPFTPDRLLDTMNKLANAPRKSAN